MNLISDLLCIAVIVIVCGAGWALILGQCYAEDRETYAERQRRLMLRSVDDLHRRKGA